MRGRPAVERTRRAWEDWGAVDPLWAIVTDPARARGGWNLEEFLASGEDTVDALWKAADRLGYPRQLRVALDFGCGIGRLTRALSRRVEVVHGLDVAASMIERAVEVNRDRPGCRFHVQRDDDLRAFADQSVDLVVCLLVLQHLGERGAIDRYLAEFVRVLAPGGLAVIQLPTLVPPMSWRGRLRLRTRLARLLRRFGVSARFLYRRLRFPPEMSMTAVPLAEVEKVLEAAGGEVIEVTDPVTEQGGVVSREYYVTRRPIST
ncbi:MAG: methyltransferase domain-containing protein [Acidimicrobiales bacterium]|nr:methyltransferase domain-containing protein [Acidimicrobiales bacterium]